MRYGKERNQDIKVWGCLVYVKRLQTNKLEARSDNCRFIGYPKETMGYYFYQSSNHKVFVARGTTFLEREFLVEGNHGKEIELDETQVTNDNITQEHEMEIEKSFFDVLKLGQSSATQTIMAQESATVQEQVIVQEVNEPILEQLQQPLNPTQEPLRRST